MLHYSFKPFEQLEEIHQLPDPFLKPDGTRISNADERCKNPDKIKGFK